MPDHTDTRDTVQTATPEPTEATPPARSGTPSEDPFEIEPLVRAAFKRARDRFVSFILAVFLLLAMYFGAVILLAVCFGIVGILAVGTRDIALTGTVAVIAFAAVTAGLMYLGSWGTLATTYTLIAPRQVKVMEAYSAMRPYVWGHVLLTALTSLLLVGLVPLSVFTLFLLLAVWGVWGAFAIFVYIEKRPRGMEALWISKEIVNTRFWGVLGRILLVNGVTSAIFFTLGYATARNEGANIFVTLLSYAVMPFLISYQYEIYRQLKHPARHASPTVWIVLAAIGWVPIAIVLASTIPQLLESLPDAMRNIDSGFQNRQTGMI